MYKPDDNMSEIYLEGRFPLNTFIVFHNVKMYCFQISIMYYLNITLLISYHLNAISVVSKHDNSPL